MIKVSVNYLDKLIIYKLKKSAKDFNFYLLKQRFKEMIEKIK